MCVGEGANLQRERDRGLQQQFLLILLLLLLIIMLLLLLLLILMLFLLMLLLILLLLLLLLIQFINVHDCTQHAQPGGVSVRSGQHRYM